MARSARLPLAAVAFLALADTGIVVLALPPLLDELGTTVEGVAAVLAVYAVVLAVALPLANLARERWSALGVALLGVALFAGGSLACGLVDTLELLLSMRAVQAVGGAAVLVSAYGALVGPGETRGEHVWRVVVLVGTLAGPALGGALTQALGWRSIFLVQAPVALLALPACLALRRGAAPDEAETLPLAEPTGHRPEDVGTWREGGVHRVIALALLAGALAAALFTTVLLLVTGWSIEPLAAAAVVSTMPLAALAGAQVHGTPAARAPAGALLMAAGTASLAFVPTSNVLWTIPPQILVGLGSGLALPALAGALLPERTTRQAARLLSIRHVGIALALLVLAPIAQHELETTLEQTVLRGAALILDSELDPITKIDIAPAIAGDAQTDDPRGSLQDGLAERRDSISQEDLAAYDDLTDELDETLVNGVNEGFSTAFLVGAGFALLAAFVLVGGVAAARRPALAGAVAGAALLVPAAYAVAAEDRRPEEVRLQDPCQERELPDTGGLAGLAQDAALRALDRLACDAGSTREELLLALFDEDAAERFEDRYGVDPQSLGGLLDLIVP